MAPKLHIGIVGGGIGGLTLAAALNHLNIEENIQIDIYEAACELKQIGAGITLWPRSLEILRGMGIFPPGQGIKERVIHLCRKSDQKEGTTILEQIADGSQLFRRSELQEILLEHISSLAIHLHPSHRLIAYKEKETHIELEFKNGVAATCDLLVGADGLNSVVRSGLLAQGKNWSQEEAQRKSQPVWSGTIVYRELLDIEKIKQECPGHLALKQLTQYCGKDKHILAYPLSKGKFMNIIVFFTDPAKADTNLDGLPISEYTIDNFASHFEDWEEDVRVIVKNMAKPSCWAIQTVKPLETYVSRRVVLMGDAAHAMSTHLANGAGQAIEDTYILSNIIAEALRRGFINLPKIAKIYDTIRQPFGNFAVEASRNQGRLYDFRGAGFEGIKEGESISEEKLVELGQQIKKGFEWVYMSARGDLEKALSMM